MYDIIRNHTVISYSSVWDHLREVDEDPLNNVNVILFYMQRSQSENDTCGDGNECTSQSWNREHVWPRSLGNFGTSTGVGTDVHNLKPATISLNSTRSNHEFDYLGTSGNAVSYSGNTTGNRLNASAGLWEPRDDVKGDLARIIMYMDLRYEGAGSEPDLVMREALNTGGTTFAVMSTLLTWHFQDTVDQFELNRNNVIANLQGNRNPLLYKNIGVDGIKTGYLAYEKYSLASTIKRNDRRIIAVGSGFVSKNGRSKESLKLLTYGLTNFDTINIAKKDE